MSPNVPLWSALTETDDRAGAQASVLTLLSVSKTRGVVRYSSLFPERVARANTLTNYKIAKCDDIVLNKMSAASGAVGVANENGLVSPDYAVFRVRSENEPRYLNHLLRSDWILSQVEVSLRGIGTGDSQNVRTPRIAIRDYLSLRAPLPDLPTQRRIADYLDRETAQIDAMAGALDGLVARLEERRISAINEKVWGLDHPAARLGYDISFVTSGSRGWSQFVSDQGQRFLRITDLNRGNAEINDKSPQFVSIPKNTEGSRSETIEGDLLFSITAYLGSIGLVTNKEAGCYVNQHIALVRLSQQMWEPKYVAYSVLSEPTQRHLKETGTGGTKTGISLGDVQKIPVPLPPLDEQRRVIAHLDTETAKIDAMIAKAGELRALLDERRSALITATVTGQHDVPEEP